MATRKRQLVRTNIDQDRQEDINNLFVFGYHCKMFDDPEKARFVEEGQHMIPWMGDPSLLIDRHDGRGYLHDLLGHDADNIPRASHAVPSLEEVQLEKLLDEERYMELHTDLMEQACYEEEELKRLNEALADDYAAVGFSYYGEQQMAAADAKQQQQEDEDSDDTEPFEAPAALQIPVAMALPKTVKENAIIEKTASFISQHGAQMEIMIKTKQQNNAQFNFLNYDDALNAYYKHLTRMIKNGKYRPQPPKQADNSGYLHPSLMGNNSPDIANEAESHEATIASALSKLPAGQIANTPYARLLSNLSKHTTGRESPQPAATSESKGSKSLHKKPAEDEASEDAHRSRKGRAPQTLPTSRIGQQNTDSNRSRSSGNNGVSSGHPNLPPVPGTEPVRLPPHPVINEQPPPPGTGPHEPLPQQLRGEIDYASATDGPSSKGHARIIPPPPDLQSIIDKMAVYVAKNGPDFETIVRNKQDERFSFLNSWDAHYPYYRHMKSVYKRQNKEEKQKKYDEEEEEEEQEDDEEEEEEENSKLLNKVISFRMKSKDLDGLSLGRRKRLLYDSSEEEGDDVAGRLSDDRRDDDSQYTDATQADPVVVDPGYGTPPGGSCGQHALLTVDQAERRIAEEKLRDRLAAAAREKMSQTVKEQHVRAERKRKAAMFINMLKSSNPAAASADKGEPPFKGAPKMPLDALESPGLSPVSSRTDSPQSVGLGPTNSSASLSAMDGYQSKAPPSNSTSRSSRRNHSTSNSPSHRSGRRSRSPGQRSARSRSPRNQRVRSRTPPSAYCMVRRSVSPTRKRKSAERSRTPITYRRTARSRSPLTRKPPKPPSSTFESLKSKSKTSSGVKQKHRSRSRSPSRSKNKSKRRSRSRSGSKSKSKHGSTVGSTSRSKVTTSSKRISRSNSKSRTKPSKRRSRSRSASKAKTKTRRRSRSRSGSTSKAKSKRRARSRSGSKAKSSRRRSRSRSGARPAKAKRRSRSRSKSKSRKSGSRDKRRRRSRSKSKSKSHSKRRRSRSGSKSKVSRNKSKRKSSQSISSSPGAKKQKKSPVRRKPESISVILGEEDTTVHEIKSSSASSCSDGEGEGALAEPAGFVVMTEVGAKNGAVSSDSDDSDRSLAVTAHQSDKHHHHHHHRTHSSSSSSISSSSSVSPVRQPTASPTPSDASEQLPSAEPTPTPMPQSRESTPCCSPAPSARSGGGGGGSGVTRVTSTPNSPDRSSLVATPRSDSNEASQTSSERSVSDNKNVSKDMMCKVRAMLKASREQVIKEETEEEEEEEEEESTFS